MSPFKEKYGPVALVAGASEGLGLAFAHRLAKEGLDLVLIARRKEVLEQHADDIRKKFSVRVYPVACDLSDTDVVSQICKQTNDLPVNFLVYNAALSYIGPYLEYPVEEHLRIVSANALGQIKLAHHYGAQMVNRQRGGMIFMASMAGFQGSGFLSTYASTKAFNRTLAESLWYEWKPKGVDVIACCAGAIATPNYINTKPDISGWIRPPVQQPEEVVNECFRKIGKTPSFVSGSKNRMAAFLMHKILSRKKAVEIMGDQTRKMYNVSY
jgi:hypothetical protein